MICTAMQIKKRCFVICCFTTALAIYLLLFDFRGSTLARSERTRYILYWNSAYGSTEYGFCCGKKPYVVHGCSPRRNCFVTNDRKLLPSLSSYDVILFHQRTLLETDLPSERSPSQKYIMFSLESPSYKMSFDSEKWNGFFNWTMTYRLDSDFPMPYGKLTSKDGTKFKDLKIYPDSRVKFGKSNAHVFAKGKTKSVAWFVSNCETSSKREIYVKGLRLHGIKIDIYGDCGRFRCPKRTEESCWNKIESEYRYYLSFENSICKDYVTEKFWNAMNRTILPIVLGGADYKSIAPEHSFIDASSSKFIHPEALARYIRELDTDDAKYAEYFWWKEKFRASALNDEDRAQIHCALCERLHLNDEEPNKFIQDMEDWWERRSKCRSIRY